MSGSRRIALSESARPAATSARCRKPWGSPSGPIASAYRSSRAASGVALSNAIENPVSRRPPFQLSAIRAIVRGASHREIATAHHLHAVALARRAA